MGVLTGCVVSRTTAQSIADSVYVAVVWNDEILDWGNMHAANSTEIIVSPFQGTATFLVTAYIKWAANVTGHRRVRIQKNGVTTIAEDFSVPSLLNGRLDRTFGVLRAEHEAERDRVGVALLAYGVVVEALLENGHKETA